MTISLYSPQALRHTAKAMACLETGAWHEQDLDLGKARRLLSMIGEQIAGAGMALAREGWEPLGTHADDGADVEFHPDLDDGGMPMWERVVPHPEGS